MIPERLRVASWLRLVGTITCIGGAIAFLVEGWTDLGGVHRELLWAAFTVSLTVLGVLAQRRFQDAVGARLFVALAAATAPIHFVVVGAAMYPGTPAHVSQADVWLVALVAAPLLPVLALGMAVLARRRATLLSAVLLCLSLPLVLPTRSGDVIGTLAFAEIALLTSMEVVVFGEDATLQTREGAVARLLLLTPIAILLGRNAYYPCTSVWLSAVVSLPSVALLALPHVSGLRGIGGRALQHLGAMGVVAASAIISPVSPAMGIAVSAAAAACSVALLDRTPLFPWLSVAAFAVTAVDVTIAPNVGYLFALLPVGTWLAIQAFRNRAALQSVSASVLTLVSFLAQCVRLVRIPRHDLWIASAAVGIALLALASFFESRKTAIGRLLTRVQTHLADEA